MKKILILLAAILMTNGMHAQNEDYDRVYAGYSMMFYNQNDPDYTGTDLHHGAQAGYTHGFSLSDKMPMYVEAGLRLSFNTFKAKEGEMRKDLYEARTNFVAVSVPVSFVYKFDISDDFYIAPYIGAQIRFNTIAEMKGRISSNDGMVAYKHNLISESGYRRFQWGGHVGVNVGYGHFNLGIGYMLYNPIFSKTFNVKNVNDEVVDVVKSKYRNNELSVSVGYTF